ncbi:MAG TPA: TRAP transporter substrate-binding protein DctP, partial [Gammaproteobacteria bacterium]|nr:TRAP transporter substrate-binding protein DctP [Gammaproteobacteria bacterium]
MGALLGVLLAGAGLPAHAADIKIATVAPDGSRWIQQMRAGAEEVNAKTAGRVTIKFYPGGVMGNDAQVLRKIRIGQLQGGAFTAGGLAERYGGLNLYGIPLLFRSLEEIDAVRAKLDPELTTGLEQAGFMTFGFIEGGFANVLANEPIHSVDDMRRKKVWVPEGDPISFMVMEALGLSPAVLPVTDVLTGLQTGLIDIAFASPVAALVLQWHTKVKYIT